MPIRKVGSDTPTARRPAAACDEPRIASQRRVDAHRDADREREQRRHEGELERRRQALDDQRRNRAPLAQAQAEFAVHRVADEGGELDVERPVEAERAA